jgi:hypothetical protein
LKNSLRCALVVATLTMRQFFRMNSWISALIQCTANDTRRTPMFRIEALDRLHQADVAFLDQVGDAQAIAGIAARDVHHEAQVRHDQLACSFEVGVVAEATCQLLLVFHGKHGNLVHGANVRVKATDRTENRHVVRDQSAWLLIVNSSF